MKLRGVRCADDARSLPGLAFAIWFVTIEHPILSAWILGAVRRPSHADVILHGVAAVLLSMLIVKVQGARAHGEPLTLTLTRSVFSGLVATLILSVLAGAFAIAHEPLEYGRLPSLRSILQGLLLVIPILPITAIEHFQRNGELSWKRGAASFCLALATTCLTLPLALAQRSYVVAVAGGATPLHGTQTAFAAMEAIAGRSAIDNMSDFLPWAAPFALTVVVRLGRLTLVWQTLIVLLGSEVLALSVVVVESLRVAARPMGDAASSTPLMVAVALPLAMHLAEILLEGARRSEKQEPAERRQL